METPEVDGNEEVWVFDTLNFSTPHVSVDACCVGAGRLLVRLGTNSIKLPRVAPLSTTTLWCRVLGRTVFDGTSSRIDPQLSLDGLRSCHFFRETIAGTLLGSQTSVLALAATGSDSGNHTFPQNCCGR